MSVSELVEKTKQDTERTKAQLLKTFEFVPDDKLHWSPSSSARTPLQIVSHCGAANKAFAALLRGEEVPLPSDPAEAAAVIRNGGREITTREGAIQLVEDSIAEVMHALDKVTPEMLETNPKSPFGPMPYVFWMQLPSQHMSVHAPQIDYIQTIWGDLEDHL